LPSCRPAFVIRRYRIDVVKISWYYSKHFKFYQVPTSSACGDTRAYGYWVKTGKVSSTFGAGVCLTHHNVSLYCIKRIELLRVKGVYWYVVKRRQRSRPSIDRRSAACHYSSRVIEDTIIISVNYMYASF